VVEGYGLTETAPVLTSTLMSAAPKAGSIGRPVPGVELRLVDPDSGAVVDELPEDSHEPLDEGGPVTGDPGEIAVRGDNLFSGYWPDGTGGPDAEGWWRTGDLAVADEGGDLYLVGRLSELMTVRGFHVYPREVEQVLDAHPQVVEAAVIGVPDPQSGQVVKAYVRAAAGATLTAEEVVAHCATRLARFKCPAAVEFVDALPHSATGKVSKGRLRAREAQDAAAAGSAS
jgi:long-chain acyl-CoA synthetase